MNSRLIRYGFSTALLITSPAMANNLVNNGDFETGDTSGWTQTGNWNTSFNGVYNSTGGINAAPDGGNYFLSLSNYVSQGTAGLSQLISTTAGQSYTLSWIWSVGNSNPAGNQFLNVLWDGQNVLSENATIQTAWTSGSTTVVGTGSDTLKIEGLANSGWNGVDNISVAAVPGPVAGAGLPVLLGFIGLGFLYRRQRSFSI